MIWSPRISTACMSSGSMAITAPARADFAAGAAAYDGGDYATAYAEWHRLAAAGDATAQTALAGLLRAGEGQPEPVVSDTVQVERPIGLQACPPADQQKRNVAQSV